MELSDYSYEDIEIGKKFSFKKTLTKEDIENFSKLTGDKNPLHLDDTYAEKTQFKGRIAHGMLAASLFSALLGMVCPGKRNLYLSQTLNFKKPIYPDSELTIQGTVENKIDAFKLVCIKTEILYNEESVIVGEAKVKMMD